MSKWQKEVFIMPADLQSESERIHYLGSKPKGAVAHPLKNKDRSKSQKRLYNFGLLL